MLQLEMASVSRGWGKKLGKRKKSVTKRRLQSQSQGEKQQIMYLAYFKRDDGTRRKPVKEYSMHYYTYCMCMYLYEPKGSLVDILLLVIISDNSPRKEHRWFQLFFLFLVILMKCWARSGLPFDTQYFFIPSVLSFVSSVLYKNVASFRSRFAASANQVNS